MNVEMEKVEIKKAGINDKEILKNLMQFYFYDFSEFVDAYVANDGLFIDYPFLDYYWEEEGRFPYLIENEGKLAGFVLITYKQEESKGYWSISEFFIMKKFRRSGLGKWVAHKLFDQHQGNWEVFQIEKNKPAQSFWRKIIDEYTDGKYEEQVEEGKVIQSFHS